MRILGLSLLWGRRSAAILTLGLTACGGATETDLFGIPPVTVDSGVVKDSGTDAKKDADVPDAPPPATPIILCGPPLTSPQAKCDASKKEFCCRRGDAQPYKYGCETDETACADVNDVPIRCSTTQTCTGQGLIGSVCCGTLVASSGSGSVITNTSCVAPNTCVSGGSVGKAVLCDPNAPNNCPNGGTCKLSSQTMPGYYLCI